MKKFIFLILLLATGSVIFAQTSKRTSAYNYLRNGKLDKAKEYIDPTITNEKTMGDAKTWFYHGNIYLQIAISDVPEYKALDPNALEVSYNSYVKCRELDERGEFTADIENNMRVIAAKFYDQGVIYYNAENFAGAATSFAKAYEMNREVGINDTTALYNAAIAAQIGQEYEMSIGYYKQLIEMGFNKPQIYNSLSEIYKSQEDTATALLVIQQGREKYPTNFDLLIAETNFYLSSGDSENALKLLELAIQQDATNPNIFFAVGTNYDQMGEFDKAENAYMEAIKLNPDYFDANYNLGALYVNEAAEIQKEAYDLPLEATEEYDKMKQEANALLEKSLPYLEKSNEINPEDMNTLRSLKEIYTRLNMLDKLKEINAKLK